MMSGLLRSVRHAARPICSPQLRDRGARRRHPGKVVSERLGHANIAITMDTYSHVLPGLDAQAAGTVARLILGDSEHEPARPVDKTLTTGPWADRTGKEVKSEPAGQEEGDRGDSNPRPSGPQPYQERSGQSRLVAS
jgi:hypothetical protein